MEAHRRFLGLWRLRYGCVWRSRSVPTAVAHTGTRTVAAIRAVLVPATVPAARGRLQLGRLRRGYSSGARASYDLRPARTPF